MTLREEIEKALKADFHSLLVKEFTADWKVQRMVHDLELEVMEFEQLEGLIQIKVDEALYKSIHKLHLCAIGKYNGDPLENVKYEIMQQKLSL